MKRQVAAHDPLHQVNGVKLHYLDWDGKGEVQLSLPGLASSMAWLQSSRTIFASSH